MKTIQLGSTLCIIKDYHCADSNEVYFAKSEDKLWLYINLTNRCNAHCPFCVNPEVNASPTTISLDTLHNILQKIKPHINGISITGGEPMLYPDLIDKVAEIVEDIYGNHIHLEMVTNGVNLNQILSLKFLDYFTAIHISRHAIEDHINQSLMGFSSPSFTQLKDLISQLKDPGKIVLNCVLQKNGVETEADISAFLEKAAWAGVRNTSFVGLFPANAFCREHYISPATLNLKKDPRFSLWNQFHDYNYCCCCSGDYHAKHGYVRFYYRCPGAEKADYVRQLVYNHDNRLLDGFGGKEIYFDENSSN